MKHTGLALTVIGDMNVDLSLAIAGWPHEGGDVLAQAVTWSSGGTGLNCAVAAARLGQRVTLLARVGTDPAAAQVLTCARDAGVADQHIQHDPTVPTGLCVIPVTPLGERTFLSYRGANVQWEYAPQLSGPSGWLHVCGHALLSDPQRHNTVAALRHAHALGWQTSIDLCDPLAAHYDTIAAALSAPVTVLLGNEREVRAARVSAPRHATVLVTKRGARGALVDGPDGSTEHPGFPVEAIDTTACGDAFGVVFCVALAHGAPLTAALQVANATGALTASRRGAADIVPTAADVIRFLQTHDTPVPTWLAH